MTIAVDSEARGNKMHEIEILFKNGHYKESIIDIDTSELDELESILLESHSAVTIKTQKGFIYINMEEINSLEISEIEENDG